MCHNPNIFHRCLDIRTTDQSMLELICPPNGGKKTENLPSRHLMSAFSLPQLDTCYKKSNTFHCAKSAKYIKEVKKQETYIPREDELLIYICQCQCPHVWEPEGWREEAPGPGSPAAAGGH